MLSTSRRVDLVAQVLMLCLPNTRVMYSVGMVMEPIFTQWAAGKGEIKQTVLLINYFIVVIPLQGVVVLIGTHL